MSYRNPKQIVDTQSGQYVRELQKSLADTYSGVASEQKKEYERRAKLNAEIVADSQKRVNKISNEINQVANANKTIDFDQMYDNLDTYNQYMKINPAKRTKEMSLFIRNMDNSGTNAKNNLANTLAVGGDFVEAREKGLGVMGGIYSATKDLEKYEVMFGYNQAPGSKKMNYNPLTNEFRVNVIGKDGKSLGSSLNQDMEHLDIPQIVPDERKNMEDINKKVTARMDLKNPNSPAYANQEYQNPTKIGNVIYRSKLPSKSVYLGLAMPLAKAELEGMTAGEGIALFNDVIGKGEVIEWQETWTDPNDPRKQIIAEAYAEHIADKFGQETLKSGSKNLLKETVQDAGKYESLIQLKSLVANEGGEAKSVIFNNRTYSIEGTGKNMKISEQGNVEGDIVIDPTTGTPKQDKDGNFIRETPSVGSLKDRTIKPKLNKKTNKWEFIETDWLALVGDLTLKKSR